MSNSRMHFLQGVFQITTIALVWAIYIDHINGLHVFWDIALAVSEAMLLWIRSFPSALLVATQRLKKQQIDPPICCHGQNVTRCQFL